MNIKIICDNTMTMPIMRVPASVYRKLDRDTGTFRIEKNKISIDCSPSLRERTDLAWKVIRGFYGDQSFSCTVDKTNRVVMCVTRDNFNRVHTGVAICAPNDEWSEPIGRAIAICRAFGRKVPKALIDF